MIVAVPPAHSISREPPIKGSFSTPTEKLPAELPEAAPTGQGTSTMPTVSPAQFTYTSVVPFRPLVSCNSAWNPLAFVKRLTRRAPVGSPSVPSPIIPGCSGVVTKAFVGTESAGGSINAIICGL